MLFEKNSVLLMIGDSITDCGRLYPFGEGEGLGSGYVSFVNAVLTAKFPQDKIKVLNTGTNGDTVRHLKARWQTDVLDLNPDYLSIMIGANDALHPEWSVGIEEYEAVYRELIAQTKDKVKKIIIFTPFLSEPDKTEPMMALLMSYIETAKKIADENDLPLVDMQSGFDKYISGGIDPKALAGDRVHPTHVGNMVIAKAFLAVCGVDI